MCQSESQEEAAAEQRRAFVIQRDQITPEVRISTGCVPSSSSMGYFWYVETWIFSKDPRVGTHQVVHGTPRMIEAPSDDNCKRVMAKARKVHGYMADGVQRKMKEFQTCP